MLRQGPTQLKWTREILAAAVCHLHDHCKNNLRGSRLSDMQGICVASSWFRMKSYIEKATVKMGFEGVKPVGIDVYDLCPIFA